MGRIPIVPPDITINFHVTGGIASLFCALTQLGVGRVEMVADSGMRLPAEDPIFG